MPAAGDVSSTLTSVAVGGEQFDNIADVVVTPSALMRLTFALYIWHSLHIVPDRRIAVRDLLAKGNPDMQADTTELVTRDPG